ncbi:hypothetical protein DIQ83_33900, partial [Mycolicibacterium smegmatis]
FVVPQRVTRATKGRARSLLRVSRRLTDTFRAPLAWTPQERADRYVARMPIAVIAD